MELLQASSDAPLPEADLYCLGGGEDGPQVRAARSLIDDGTLARRAAEGRPCWRSAPAIRSSGGAFRARTATPHEGVGLLDIATDKGAGTRAVGEVVAEVSGVVAAPT